MTLQMDGFLQDFIGYGQDEIAHLDVEWETYHEGLDAGYSTRALVGPPVLVYQAPDGDMRSKPMTEDVYHRCREALMADIQDLGS